MVEVSESVLKLEELKRNFEEIRTCEQILKVKDALQAKCDEIEAKIENGEKSCEDLENFEINVEIPYMELTEEVFELLTSYGYTIIVNSNGITLRII